MPAPGYIFLDGGTTPPPESEEGEREFLSSKEAKRARASTLGKASVTSTATATTEPSQPAKPTSRGRRAFSLLNRKSTVSSGTGASTGTNPQVPDKLTPGGGGGSGGSGASSIISSIRTSRDHRRHISDNLGNGQPVLSNGHDGTHDHDLYDVDVDDDAHDFTPSSKLRASVDRLYNTVVVGLIRFNRQLSHLRSWKHSNYTGAYAAVYAFAWLFGLIVPTLLLGIIILIAVPEARAKVFPPKEIEDDGKETKVNGTTNDVHPNSKASLKIDTTKEKKTPSIRTQLIEPATHTFDLVSDMWERFANALSPTRPFTDHKRHELAAILIPIFFLSLTLRLEQILRVSSFLAGLVFFSKPTIQRAVHFLDTHVPDWRRAVTTYLDPRTLLLGGVPNNAELATVLRNAGGPGHGRDYSASRVRGMLIPPPVSGRTSMRTAPTSSPTTPITPTIITSRPPAASNPAISVLELEGSKPSTTGPRSPATPTSTRPVSMPVVSSSSSTPGSGSGSSTVPFIAPPIPPIPNDYPPSSFRASGSLAPESGDYSQQRSQSQSRGTRSTRSTRTRSLSRSRLGRKIASVLNRNSNTHANTNGQTSGNENENDQSQTQTQSPVGNIQQQEHKQRDSQYSTASFTPSIIATGTPKTASSTNGEDAIIATPSTDASRGRR